MVIFRVLILLAFCSSRNKFSQNLYTLANKRSKIGIGCINFAQRGGKVVYTIHITQNLQITFGRITAYAIAEKAAPRRGRARASTPQAAIDAKINIHQYICKKIIKKIHESCDSEISFFRLLIAY